MVKKWLLLLPLFAFTIYSDEVLTFTTDSLAVISILKQNGLEGLSVNRVAKVDSLSKRIIGLDFQYQWSCGCIGNVRVPHYLQNLPKEISRLSELKYLYLGDNGLDSLPAQIGDLSKLEEIRIGITNISSLPDAFSRLTALQKIYIDVTKFKLFPDMLFDFSSLRDLRLFHCNFDTISGSLGNLKLLETLSIQFGNISKLPQEIGLLSKLTRLDIYSTRLISLPSGIGNLTVLTDLQLFRNQLAFLPGEITKIRSLKRLVVTENRLCAVPDSIALWIDNYSTSSSSDWRNVQQCASGTLINRTASHTGHINIRSNASSRLVIVSYQLPVSSFVSLSLYDLHGRKLKTLLHSHQSGGRHDIICPIKDISCKMYLLGGEIGNTRFTRIVPVAD